MLKRISPRLVIKRFTSQSQRIVNRLDQNTLDGLKEDRIAQVQRKLSLIEACLRTNQMERAQILFNAVIQQNKNAIQEGLVNTSLLNLFIRTSSAGLVSDASRNASLAADGMKQSLLWYQRLKSLQLQPNVTTYALLLKAAINFRNCSTQNGSKSTDFVKIILSDFRKNMMSQRDNVGDGDNDLTSLFKHYEFTESEVKILNEYLFQKSQQQQADSGVTYVQNESNLPQISAVNTPNMAFVQQNLKALDANFENLVDLQIHVEQESFRISQEQLMLSDQKVKDVTGIGRVSPELKKLSMIWLKRLTTRISGEIQHYKENGAAMNEGQLGEYLPFLMLFEKEPEKVALATISQFIKAFSNGRDSIKAANLVLDIGQSAEQEHRMMLLSDKKLRQKMVNDYVTVQKLVQSNQLFQRQYRKAAAQLGKEEMDVLTHWSRPVNANVGSLLCSMMLDSAQIALRDGEIAFDRLQVTPERALSFDVELVDAFSHGLVFENGKQHGIVRVHEAVLNILGSAEQASNLPKDAIKSSSHTFIPKLLPMLVPPKPWTDHESGGYLTIRTAAVRGITRELEAYLKHANLTGSMDRVFGGLDALGRTKWRVNEDLLKHIIYAWNNGEKVSKLPVEQLQRPAPIPKPDDFESNAASRAQWHRAVEEQTQSYYDAKSIKISENYKIEIARSLAGRTLYFPHNMDFRGRAYPIAQLFNHMGNDLSRSLLIFDDPKPLGSTGLRWLKIHLANCYGFDKATFDEREQFADSVLNKIHAAAENPFAKDDGNARFWINADKPWLTLSTAMEISNAIKSGKPEEYLSRLPVHQDGSCNGLQHYAALGGDYEGACQVNLASGFDRPQDVYSAVASKVRKMVQEDMESIQSSSEQLDFSKPIKQIDFIKPGVQKILAELIGPERIDRKVVKQTVMTSVYGVTAIGARDQIANRLKEKYYPHTFSEEQIFQLSRYVAPKVFSALDDTFKEARKIQNWLAQSAKILSKSLPPEQIERSLRLLDQLKSQRKLQQLDQSSKDSIRKQVKSLQSSSSVVVWTTPLGMVVAQPYKDIKHVTISTAMQSFTLKDHRKKSSVDVSKQVQGFPPNFIHSLDATHMLMTALECYSQGMTFASVHDSYWTHACDVDRLRIILKEQFVKMHSQPIMENLQEELMLRYGHRKIRSNEKIEPVDDVVASIDSTSGNDQLPNSSTSGEEVSSPQASENTSEGVKKRRGYFYKNIELPPLPPKGDFDINQVLNSEYFFN
ncbi:hypothetical protein MP228_011873 [Amoeboaphelidium protococcarum]|nr:hypothetical protein MP228_011873 [Amoeboaphelidium protococcarum]